MKSQLEFEILPQPDETTCGPTCLHAVYRYFGDSLSLNEVIAQTHRFEGGGTLAVFLGSHALRRGYRATIYTFNLHVFDPTWFAPEAPPLEERLLARQAAVSNARVKSTIDAYVEFLRLGGKLRMQDLTGGLIRKYLKREIPILTGVSATYLYAEKRERLATLPDGGARWVPDDIAGEPAGHFIVLCGYDQVERKVLVADPLMPNPMAHGQSYEIALNRVKCSILLGILTYDANLLVLEPKGARRLKRRVEPAEG